MVTFQEPPIDEDKVMPDRQKSKVAASNTHLSVDMLCIAQDFI
jgi:hypothetical protein